MYLLFRCNFASCVVEQQYSKFLMSFLQCSRGGGGGGDILDIILSYPL